MVPKPRGKKPGTTATVVAPPPEGGPPNRPATPEEQAQIMAQQQRARVELAVLKQRFADAEVRATIAEGERDQLIQQNQFLQRENEALKAEVETLKKPKSKKGDEKPESKES